MSKRVYPNRLLLGFALALLSLGAVPACQAQVTIGNTDTNNLFPIGTSFYAGEYQQAYAGSAFSGPVSITAIAFKSTNIPGFANSITDNLSISLSTTSASLSSLSTTYAANKGADNTTVFSGVKVINPLANNTFDTVFAITPFSYDPSQGNLLMDVFINSNVGGPTAFAAGTGSTDTSRVYNGGGFGSPQSVQGEGLQTQFTVTTTSSSVPEPSAAVLVGIGMAGLIISRRRPGR